ncbi:hypothetical protein J6590_003064 [Homalodisca vitripennis]|nr:hypothetical protein J6590_003064 [Homalodisca vitripennis]
MHYSIGPTRALEQSTTSLIPRGVYPRLPLYGIVGLPNTFRGPIGQLRTYLGLQTFKRYRSMLFGSEVVSACSPILRDVPALN